MPAVCNVCFRHCELSGTQLGFCRARKCLDRQVVSDAYGKVTALHLDPIEKKPLARFHPGGMVLSVGSYGCNLRCPFCQNHEIAQAGDDDLQSEFYSPDKLAALAEQLVPRGNLGIAFTYNEPLINYEFVRDTFQACKQKGLKTVLVSNGTAEPEVLQKVLPLTDAVNFDLKAFRKETYGDVLKGDLESVQYAIMMAADRCHLELTNLVVPGMNDDEEEFRDMVKWIASLQNGWGSRIPLHVTRFFPCWKYTDRPPTDVDLVYRFADLAREHLQYVYTGNC
ncbi:MAG: AmmeMemoRadiSam system radical SAM enzyme [Clostridia bacterium]|nr:AmmeMemoRadiSam system radical SAM enzyme [Clostridia bacterium]